MSNNKYNNILPLVDGADRLLRQINLINLYAGEYRFHINQKGKLSIIYDNHLFKIKEQYYYIPILSLDIF